MPSPTRHPVSRHASPRSFPPSPSTTVTHLSDNTSASRDDGIVKAAAVGVKQSRGARRSPSCLERWVWLGHKAPLLNSMDVSLPLLPLVNSLLSSCYILGVFRGMKTEGGHPKKQFDGASPRDRVTRVEMDKHKTQKKPETFVMLWCSRARFSPLCRVQAKHPDLYWKIFHLGPTCLAYMWCSFKIVRGRSWSSQKPLWQLWEDILSLYESKTKEALTGSLQSL